MFLYGFIICVMALLFYTFVELSKLHKNYEKRELDNEYFVNCAINYSITCIFALSIIFFREEIFLPSGFPDMKTILLYFLIVDTIYYWMHRTIHRIPFLKRFLHEHHHEHDCIPLDFLNLTSAEFSLYMLNTNILPLFFIPISLVSYLTIFILIMFHSIYTHSELDAQFPIPGFIDSTYHRYHHQIGRGNYAVFFPIWDDFMNTRISPPTPPAPPTPPRQKEEKINEKKNNDSTK